MRALRRLLREERGDFSLTATLVSLLVFAGVLGATLTTYVDFTNGADTLTARADAQDRARRASDTIARTLRNLASPQPDQPQAFDFAGPYDLIFKTVDPIGPNAGLNASNVRRVRFCLDNSGNLWQQVQTWTSSEPPAAPDSGSCPSGSWTNQSVIAQQIANRTVGRNLFTVNAQTLTDISSVHLDLYTTGKSAAFSARGKAVKMPATTMISTGVFLRNQNRRPIAVFTATPTAQGIVLNGSASYDPEGEPLQYAWYDGSTKVGTGITYTYPVASGTEHYLQLKVFDPASLEGDAPVQDVTA